MDLACKVLLSGHILDLYCVRLANVGPFFENYLKLSFDAKHLVKSSKVVEVIRTFFFFFQENFTSIKSIKSKKT